MVGSLSCEKAKKHDNLQFEDITVMQLMLRYQLDINVDYDNNVFEFTYLGREFTGKIDEDLMVYDVQMNETYNR